MERFKYHYGVVFKIVIRSIERANSCGNKLFFTMVKIERYVYSSTLTIVAKKEVSKQTEKSMF